MAAFHHTRHHILASEAWVVVCMAVPCTEAQSMVEWGTVGMAGWVDMEGMAEWVIRMTQILLVDEWRLERKVWMVFESSAKDSDVSDY